MKGILLILWVLASTWIVMLFSKMLYDTFKGKGIVYAFLFGCMISVILLPASVINILLWHLIPEKLRDYIFEILYINKNHLSSKIDDI